MTKFNVETYSEQSFGLGEGPFWCPDSNRLYFVDLTTGFAAWIDENKEVKVLFRGDDNVTSVVPVKGEKGKIVVSVGPNLYCVDTCSGDKKLIDFIDKDGVRFNDAKCDAKGRLWIGSMARETAPGVFEPEQGSLYLLTDDGRLEIKMKKVTISNGLAWSLDNKKMYFVDSQKKLIYRFNYDLKDGDICKTSVFIDMNNDFYGAKEIPDGMTIDVNGNLWVAMYDGGRVINFDGDSGEVIQEIRFPTSLITSVCFAGPDLSELYVTSALTPLDEERRQKQPLAGYIFKVTSQCDGFRGFKVNTPLKL